MTGLTIDQLKKLITDTVTEQIAPLHERQGQMPEWLANAIAQTRVPDLGKPEKGIRAAQVIRAFAATKGIPSEAAKWAAKAYGENHDVTKSLAAGTGSAGGYIIPPEFSTEIIELLRGIAVVRGMRPIIVPMDNGSLTMSGIAGGSSASYIGELANIPRTEPSFNQPVNMTWKKLAALVPISNDLLRYSNPAADTIVRDDLVTAMALREDLAFLRGDGLSNTPKGLRFWAAAPNILVATATVNLANVRTDLNRMVTRLNRNFSRKLRVGWIIPVGVEAYLQSLYTGGDNKAFPEMDNGRLLNYPYAVSSQIPENLGAGTNETEIYLVDFADVMIGEASDLAIDVSTEAAYHDGTNLQSAFSRDETVMRAIAEHDFAPRHVGSIVVLTGVTWGTGL